MPDPVAPSSTPPLRTDLPRKAPVSSGSSQEEESQARWYHRNGPVILWLILFFPVGLYGMWKGQRFSPATRSIVTIIYGIMMVANMVGHSKNRDQATKNNEKVQDQTSTAAKGPAGQSQSGTDAIKRCHNAASPPPGWTKTDLMWKNDGSGCMFFLSCQDALTNKKLTYQFVGGTMSADEYSASVLISGSVVRDSSGNMNLDSESLSYAIKTALIGLTQDNDEACATKTQETIRIVLKAVENKYGNTSVSPDGWLKPSPINTMLSQGIQIKGDAVADPNGTLGFLFRINKLK